MASSFAVLGANSQPEIVRLKTKILKHVIDEGLVIDVPLVIGVLFLN
jgi:hypothetical protein